jgi:site-specific recombinase XerC
MAVFKKNDAWWIDYYYQGCRYRQKIGSRRRDAEEASAQIKVKIAAGDFVPPADRKRQEEVRRSIAFESFATADFLEYSKVDHARSHHSQQRMIVTSHLIPYFGGMQLDEIVSKDIEKYKRIRSQKVGHSTVNRELFCLKKLFGKAVEWGELSENPARGVKTFKETPKRPQLLELDEVLRLLEECKQENCRVDLFAFVCCIVYAGLRKSEVLNLRWDGIDHARGHITVQSRPEWHTKNYESRPFP